MSKCYNVVLGGVDAESGGRYLLQNMDWLDEELGGFDDDYLIFDCPGALSLS